MFFRLLVLILFGTFLQAQNNLIIYSSNGKAFHLSSKNIAVNETTAAEYSFPNLLIDTIDLTLISKNKKIKLNSTVYLLNKGAKTTNKTFIYALETDTVKSKFNLRFLGIQDSPKLPNPLVPDVPYIDTSYKMLNKLYGDIFELKDGKPLFFNNLPKSKKCLTPTSDKNVSHVLNLNKKTNVKTDRVKFSLETINNNCVTCAQVALLCQTLDFELDRIKVIKEAFKNITDPENKKLLEESVTFESGKKEIRESLVIKSQNQLKNTKVCAVAVPDSVVKLLYDNLKLYNNDFDRVIYLKSIDKNNCYTSIQLKNLLNTFLHDREKLEVCKLYYHNIVDKENLESYNDVFSFNETYNKYLDFLKQPD